MFTSISFIAIIAFFITLGVVIYEVYVLKKKKTEPGTTTVPTMPNYSQDPLGVQALSAIPTIQQPTAQTPPPALPPLTAQKTAVISQINVQKFSLDGLKEKKKLIIGIISGALVIVLIVIGFMVMRGGEKEQVKTPIPTDDIQTDSKQGNDEDSPLATPSSSLLPSTTTPSADPTPLASVTPETSLAGPTPNENGYIVESNNGLADASLTPTSVPTIDPLTNPEDDILVTDASDSAETDSESDELPRTGVLGNSILVVAISTIFLVLAFAL